MPPKKSVHFSKSANQTLYVNQSSEDEQDADDEGSMQDEAESTEAKVPYEDVARSDSSAINPAWADAMARLLGSSASKKSDFILAKAKKDRDLVDKPKPVSSFEVVSEDGKANVVTSEVKRDQSLEKTKGKIRPKTKVLQETLKSTDQCDRAKELRLTAIATKGVVQLFNAVNAQLNQMAEKVEEAGPLEGKQRKARAAIDEDVFMETLDKMNEDIDPEPEDKQEAPKKKRRRKTKEGPASQPFSKVFTDDFAAAM